MVPQSNNKTLTVNAKDLIHSIERVITVSIDRKEGVKIAIKKGEIVYISSEKIGKNIIPISGGIKFQKVKKGARVLIDDGKISLEVEKSISNKDGLNCETVSEWANYVGCETDIRFVSFAIARAGREINKIAHQNTGEYDRIGNNFTHWKNNPMEYKISSKTINTKSKFNIYLAAGGGFAIEIVKK